MKRNILPFVAVVLSVSLASVTQAALLSWGAANDLPNGVLGLTSLAVNAPEVIFTNPGGEGFDVGVTLTSPNTGFNGNTGFFGSGVFPVLPTPPPPAGQNHIFLSPASGSPNTVYLEMRFYATGTTDPFEVTGFKTQLEDVERGGSTREWLVGPKITTGGVDQHLSFSDTSIFTIPDDAFSSIIETGVTVGTETVERAVPGFPVVGGTQAGKTVGIDLSDTPLSFFRIGTSKGGNGGSWLMGAIGDIRPVPEPSAAALLALGGMGLAIRRRREKAVH